MALEMRTACERCAAALLPDGPARACSFECTFCERCAREMGHVCPNCQGELLVRPRRGPRPAPALPWETSAGGFTVSDDPSRLDFVFIHEYLARSYWSPQIPMEIVRRGAANSISLGVYERTPGSGSGSNSGGVEGEWRQVAFGRVITDRATYAYLCDIFVIESMRGKGLSALLMRAILSHPDLQGLRRWMLITRDAHGLYRKFGFVPSSSPEGVMEMLDRDVYKRAAAPGATR